MARDQSVLNLWDISPLASPRVNSVLFLLVAFSIWLGISASSLFGENQVYQSVQIVPSVPISRGQFGWSVALDGNTAAVGRLTIPSRVTDPRNASVGIYEYDGGRWNETAVILDGEPLDEIVELFGYSIDLQDGLCVIGDPSDSRVLLYEESGGTWTKIDEFEGPVEGGSGTFYSLGTSVSLDGNVFAAGHPDEREVHVFVKSGGQWTFAQKLTAPVEVEPYQFGNLVSVSEDRLAAGFRQDEVLDGETHRGDRQVYIFERLQGQWVESGTLESDGLVPEDEFGASFSLNGNTCAVGSTKGGPEKNGARTGEVCIFEHDGTSWVQTSKVDPGPDSNAGTFGYDVSLDGDTLAVSTFKNGVYVFKERADGWKMVTHLSGNMESLFGKGVCVDGNRFILGSPYEDILSVARSGVAYIFDPDPPVIATMAPEWYTIGAARVGERVYCDREEYRFIDSIPSDLEGWPLIQCANDDKATAGWNHLRFTVDRPVTLTVAYDERFGAAPAWLRFWSKRTDQLQTNDPYAAPLSGRVLYERDFPAGRVALGGNIDPGMPDNFSMYSVIVAPRYTGPSSAQPEWNAYR